MAKLKSHLAVTYAAFLRDKKLSLNVNGVPIAPLFFDKWAFPPDYPPQGFYKWLHTRGDHKDIRFQIVGGLTIEGGSIGGEYGVYFYCNHRLISRAVRVPEVGFSSGLAGIPHPRMSLARIIVDLGGPSNEMPWTSNKTNINYSHLVFRAVQGDIIQMVKTFTGLSKSLQQDFDEAVAPYSKGEVEIQKLTGTESI